MSRLVIAALLALGLGEVVNPNKAPPDPRDYGADKIDVSAYPDDQQQRYPLFMQKCSKCHPAARAINSRFSTGEWKRYMKRMIRRPNSGINEEQAVEIYAFLKFYAEKQGGQ